MAEGQAKAGHDIMGLRTWYVSSQADKFVPVDEIVEPVVENNTARSPKSAEYCGKIGGHWMAVPTSYGSGASPPCAVSTISRIMSGSTCRRCIRPARRPTRR